MTAIDYKKHPEKHPFYCGSIKGSPFFDLSAADRIYKVKSFDMQQCIAAIELPEILQKTVRQAIQRRMKQLREANSEQL